MFLLETAIPYESIGIVGVLITGVIALWKVNTRLVKQNEELHAKAVEKAEKQANNADERANRLAVVLEKNAVALTASVQAMEEITETFKNYHRVLERVMDRLESLGGNSHGNT